MQWSPRSTGGFGYGKPRNALEAPLGRHAVVLTVQMVWVWFTGGLPRMAPRQIVASRRTETSSCGHRKARSDGVVLGRTCGEAALSPLHDASIGWLGGGLDVKSAPWCCRQSLQHSMRGTRCTGFRRWFSFGQTRQRDQCCKFPVMMIGCLMTRFPNLTMRYELGRLLGTRNLGKVLCEKHTVDIGHTLCNHVQSTRWR